MKVLLNYDILHATAKAFTNTLIGKIITKFPLTIQSLVGIICYNSAPKVIAHEK